MTTITIKELHARTGDWVRRAGENGEITVTDRGHPIAVIRPLVHSTKSANQQPLSWIGSLASAKRTPRSVVPPIIKGFPTEECATRPNPFTTRKVLPGFAELQARLAGGTDSARMISEDRDRA